MSDSTAQISAALEAIRQALLRGEASRAAELARAATARWPQNIEAHNLLGVALTTLERPAEAERAFHAALSLQQDYAPALSNLGMLLADHDEPDAAEPLLSRAVKLGARPPIWARLATLVSPLPESVAQIDLYRQVTAGRIGYLHQQNFRLDVNNLLVMPMFYLAYHGRNDRDLQQQAAKLFEAPQPALQRRREGRMRIGFISDHFRDHTIARLNVGLIEKLSRDQFEVFVFSTSEPKDALAAKIRAAADEFIVLPPDLALTRQTLVDKQLDVLFYTDVGMERVMYTLAMSRLAPIQCATWGHPTTTGISTIDYFISSEALETPASDGHYTERLARLKNLAVCYERPQRVSAERAKFGFDKDVRLYVCPQTPYKFHPDFDPVIAEILRRDPRGRVVLVDTHGNKRWKQKLTQRWQKTIPDVLDRVITLPAQPRNDFLTLLATADVLLDPLHFGGGNTSYEALAMGTPIVTLPSEFLRGRITYALYQAMGLIDAIAKDPAHYIDLALSIAADRSQIARKIDKSSPRIFESIAGVRDLEAFLAGVIDAL